MKTIIFDIDKTLLVGSHCHFYSFRLAFRELFDVDVRIDIGNIQGMTDKEIIFRTGAEHGLEIGDEEFRRIVDRISCNYRLNLGRDNIRALDGAGAVLERLRDAGIPLGVVTGNIEPVAWLKLRAASFDTHFSFGGFGNEGCSRASILRLALERASGIYGNLKAGDVIAVGDTPRDIAAGREVGVTTVGVATGDFSMDELEEAGADHVLEGLFDVDAFLEIAGYPYPVTSEVPR
ncbi:HAD family hydrolase [Methanothermobacter thermautotrophicus]|jgi:phosphoglycolate phosphatase|uniref:HAD family hydrolase n=1 Tax=Methanothermobacter thermautotrophicus TaxID=145262 RepID=A0A842YM73_METTF|nr:HAD family hydrolase [Methanothermobacter thermautotrophicus]MBE2900692.1 HAD family hydrolase [Methanothermobacter thermautotrophicus]MCQ8905224.1 HAD family hydrolase [Methanothermobacter sp.]